MSSLDLGNLTPQDAVVALRSYPRRYAAVLQPPDGADVDADERAARPGPDGVSALDVVAGVDSAWERLAESLRQVVVIDDPLIELPGGDPSGRAEPATTVDDAVIVLEARATGLADQIDRVPGESWGRSGRVGGDSGSPVTALELVQEAVKLGREGLDRVQRTLDAVDG